MQGTTTSQASLVSLDKEVPVSVAIQDATTNKTESALSVVRNKLHIGKKIRSKSSIVKKRRKIGVVELNHTPMPVAFSDNVDHVNKVKVTNFASEEEGCSEQISDLKQFDQLDTTGHASKTPNDAGNVPFPSKIEDGATKLKQKYKIKTLKFSKPHWINAVPKGNLKRKQFKLTHQNSFQKFGHLSLLTPALILEPAVHGVS